MASIHKQSSQSSSKSSSFGSKSGNSGSSWGRRLADEILDDFDVPISRKGRFFQDSSFEHARDDFDAAVQDVLKKWGGDKETFFDDKWDDSRDRNLRHSDSFSRYRNLRSRNLKDDNQAVTVTSDNNTHKIVLDVHGLQEGDVKVKLVGERELVVEGRLAVGDAQPFKRRFSLPQEVQIGAITSVMSSDGILTITAPKAGRQSTDKGSTIPINVTETAKTDTSESSNLNSTTSKTANSASSASCDTETVEQEQECDCDVCVAKYGKKSAQQQKSAKTDNQNASQTKESQSTFTAESRTESKQGVNNLGSGVNNGFVDASGSKEKITRESEQRDRASSETQQSDSKQGSAETKTQSQKSSSSASMKSEFCDVPFSFRESLPIKRRGHYFDDSFFEDTRKDFHSTVNDILRKWGETDFLDDSWDNNLRRSESFSRYRKLREHNLKDDNQAITVTSDTNTHKIVVDVQEFMEGDVKVKLVGERELVVEGHNPSGTSHSFKRSFPLPENVRIAEITSVMSSDGILTITAPKIVYQSKESDKTIPIKVCQTESSTSTTSSKVADSHLDDRKQTTDQSSSHEKREKILTTTENKENTSHSVGGSQRSCEQFVRSQETSKLSGSGSTQKVEEDKLSHGERERQGENETHYVSSKHSESNTSTSASIPIKRREGLFFKDSLFEGAWKDYQDAMRDVLTQWGDDKASYSNDKAASFSEDLSSYRKLRTSDMREENQAVSTTEDEHSYKFIIDVHDFLDGGDINVRAVEDRELVVQGRVDVQDVAGCKSTKRFLRLFVLPDDVRCEDVYSVVSSDGILTIIAPKKTSRLQLQEEERRQDSASLNQSISSSRQADKEARVEDHVIPVKVVVTQDGQIVDVNAGEMSSQGRPEEQRHKSASREREINIDVETTHKDAAMKKDVHFADDDNEVDAVHRRLDGDHDKDQEENEHESAASENAESSRLQYMSKDFDEVYKNKLIPIKTRGSFFEDFFFEDSRQSFNTAVREVLEKASERVPSPDDVYSAYRNLRQRNLQLDNQAGRIDEDPRFQWIVLDVYDFLDGEVTAEVVDGREIVVKGIAKRHEGNSLVTISFLRRFQLSEHVNLEAIKAAMSSDGVLIIIAPKLPLHSELGGVYGEELADLEHRSRIDAGDVAGRILKDRNLRESSTDTEGRCSFRLASPLRGHKEMSTERQSADRCDRQIRSSSRDSSARLRHSPDLASSSQSHKTTSHSQSRTGEGRSWEEMEDKSEKKSSWEDSSKGNSSSSYSVSSSSSYQAQRRHSPN